MSGFPIGRIAGIPLRVNWTVIIIVLLVGVGLASGGLPSEYPGHSAAVYALCGVIAAVALVLSILAHEIAHSIVARRNGIGVSGITLWMFGGVSRLSSTGRTPGMEFRIAGAGPFTSFLLGVIALGVGGVIVGAAGNSIVAGVFIWLGITNVTLAVFNLLPGAPLDGGRLLRALVWRFGGDPQRAQILAARAGTGLGLLLVAGGIVEVFAGLGASGVWLVLLGWLLIGSAQSEERQADIETRLRGVPVSQVMVQDPPVVPAWLTLDAFIASAVLSHSLRAFPIADEAGRLTGLVTLAQVRAVPRAGWGTTRLRDIACALDDVAVARPDEPVTELLSRFTDCSAGHAPVVVDGRVVGLVTPEAIERRAGLVSRPA